MVFVKILTLIAAIFACVLVIQFRLNMVQFFGKASWAEQYLGSGGTYNMWILIGLGMVAMAAFWLMGAPN